MSFTRSAGRVALAAVAVATFGLGQIVQGSFEGGTPGASAPPAPWTNNGAVLVMPSGGCTTDPGPGFPSAGANWMRIASGGGAATPTSYANSNRITQVFTTGAAGTQLHLDVAFSTGEGPGSFFNDFLAVSVAAGTTTQTLLVLETATAVFPTTACLTSLSTTALTPIDVDLATVLPGITSTTPITLRVHCANGVDDFVTSYAYVDNVYLGVPPPPPVDINVIPNGGGNWTLHVISAGHPNAEVYNLFSLVVLNPTGTGPVFGIHFNVDVLNQMLTPVGAHPFHVLLDGTGQYFAGPIPIPSGLTVDAVSIVVSGGVVLEYSVAKNFDF
jgi:hypothetical protein